MSYEPLSSWSSWGSDQSWNTLRHDSPEWNKFGDDFMASMNTRQRDPFNDFDSRRNDFWDERDTFDNDFFSGSDSFESDSGLSSYVSWPNYLGQCLNPTPFDYIIAIIVQVLFIGIYAGIYAACFSKKDSVTKMHMFILYINTSFWGWLIYIFVYRVICNGWSGTDIFITALVFLGIFGGSSCIEMCCSREGGYFRHQKTMNECIQYMNNMKETAPIHRVDIECYHYRTHTRTDSKGRTHTTRRKVVTYTEWREFIYDRWIDESDYPNLPEISMETPIVALESNFIVAPGDDFTLYQFDNFRKNFVEQNRHRDWYIDETVRTLLPGHEADVTAKSDKKNEVPWWLNCGLFYFLAILFCSCPLRVLFRSRSKQHKFEIRKLYFLEPTGANIGNMGKNVTINVVDNTGIVNINTDPNGMPMVQQQGQNMGPMSFVQPTGQQYRPPTVQPPMQEKPTYSSALQGYPSAKSSYPSAPAGYQPVHNPTSATPTAPLPYNPTAPPPYNTNMP